MASADIGSESGIAIIGIGCRFPGGAGGPRAFWSLLKEGFDAITEAPASRPGFNELFDPDPRKPGRVYTRRGGFLERVDLFDAQFFGISPREATRIDPQHRLLLEMVWEACEDAGLPPPSLAGSRTGVFVGISTHDYGDMQMYPQNRSDIDMYSNSGTATSIAANRISYIYDLRGPSVAVDTACSSVMTAVHLACQSLHTGDCRLAIVGGVQMLLAPELTIGFCKAAMLSRDGQSRAFDASANGYVRSEGAGVVILKPLQAALADGDPIYAVIRATAVNQDGRTTGMTVPSRAAQQAMLEEALAKAGLTARDVQYVEAHGTGTPVGDPIEAAAIGAVMSQGRGEDEFCAIGSVKTNIGHIEAASGMAGLIKVALALKHRQIPASLHFERANEAIDFQALRLRVVTKLEPWPECKKAAVAGVNSFGFGGANAHALLQEPPRLEEQGTSLAGAELEIPQLLVVSARSAEALKAQAVAYSRYIGDGVAPPLGDICYTAAQRRAHHDFRLSVVANRKEDFAECLSAFASGEDRLNIASGRSSPATPPKIAFVFSGIGPQWWGMGRQLRAEEPVFREALERCDQALRGHADWSLLEELSAEEKNSRVAAPELVQTTNFAIQAALVELWASWGITPHAVIGQSGGAMAAAWAAGVYELEDAIRLAFHRSRLQGQPSNEGKMLAVGVPLAEIVSLLEGTQDRVCLAAVNGPTSITLAGDGDTLEKLCASLNEMQIFARLLPGNVAYHSPAMDKIKEEFLASVSGLRGRTARIPLVSDTTGTWADGAECDAQYWWRAIREPAIFYEGMKKLLGEGMRHFLEIGPHPVLAYSVVECMKEQNVKGLALPSLRRNEDERAIMLRSLGALYANGFSPNWAALQAQPARLVPLPGYVWQRERHWFEPVSQADTWSPAVERRAGDHSLLGTRTRSARPTWENLVGADGTEYLKEHVVQGSAVCPGAAYVELALAARSALDGQDGVLLRDVEFLRPLLLNGSGGTHVQMALDPESGRFELFSAVSADAKSWIRHAQGSATSLQKPDEVMMDLDRTRQRLSRAGNVEEFYTRMAERGLAYGPVFRGIHDLWTGEREALGSISVSGLEEAGVYRVHPALLDAAFQLLVAAADTDAALAAQKRLFLPTGIREVRFYAKPGEKFWALASLNEVADSTVSGNIRLINTEGKVCADVRGLTARLLEAAGHGARESIDHWLYDYRWESKPRDASETIDALSASVLSGPLSDPVLEEARRRADAVSAETGWQAYYSNVEGRLNELASAYVFTAFSGWGCEFREGVRLSPDSVCPATDGWRRSLARQMFAMLERADLVRQCGDVWEATGNAPRGTPAQLAGEILRDFPNHRLDVELLGRCGPRLGEVVVGRCDGRDVLFTDEGFDLLQRFYRESPASAFYNSLVASLVSDLTVGCADTLPLNILEVGAGTGGTTAHILPGLNPERTSYVFTDVSPLLLERARAKFDAYPFLTPKLFDVTRDSATQGFQPRSFDLIIGANVLHATPVVEHSVRRLKDLLAPGGVLLLLEITSHPWWLDIVFGLMDGWWKFEDRELRPNHPLMPGSHWRELLERCGLQGTAIVADSVPAGEPAQSVILGHRLGEEILGASPALTETKHLLIFADQRGVGRRLAEIFAARGHGCSLVCAGAEYKRAGSNVFELRPDSAEDFARLREELQPLLPQIQSVVHLWSVDAGEPSSAANDFFAKAQIAGCGSLLLVLQRLVLGSPLAERGLVLVTAGAQTLSAGSREPALLQAPVWGFGRVVLKELPGLRCRMIDLSADCLDREIDALADEILSGDAEGAEEEIALRSGNRLVHRLRATSLAEIADAVPPAPAVPEDAWRAEISITGSLESLVLRRGERRLPGPHEVEVAVSAAGLNFRDIVLALGVVPGLEADNTFGKKQLGSDFAGTITRCGDAVKDLQPGDNVLGIAPSSFSSYAVTNSALVVRRPGALEARDAATLPVAFVTAWYALKRLAHLSAGESVLVHAASGGVGLAAIQIARMVGARVFATAGSEVKRCYLKSLGVEEIMDSRTLDFADEILERTGGRGVDVVLNSLPREAMERGIAVLAPYGRFVELGKADIYQNQRMELGPFRKNLTFYAVDLDRMSIEKPQWVGEMLREIVDQIGSGALTPLPYTEFEMGKLAEAMRYMAQAKHIGKVVVTNGSQVMVRTALPAQPPIRADATYLITGGLGGLGLEVARWLVERGAKALVLMGRSAPSLQAEVNLLELRNLGARIEVMAGDISKEQDVRRTVDFIRANMAPLRGIFHAAMVLQDLKISELDQSGFDKVMAPKVQGAWNLHTHTLSEPLDFFVSFSSITSLLGNPQQANYAAANAFLDAFAAWRRARGLPATTINWGVISGSGYVARHEEIGKFLAMQGYLSFAPEQTLEVLGEVLRHDAVQVMAARIDWKKLRDFAPRVAASNRLRHLVPAADGATGQVAQGSLRAMLEGESPAARGQRLEQYLREQVGKLLGASPVSVETERPLTELGLDSLIAVELTVVLERDLGIEVPGIKLLAGLDIRGLAGLILELLGLEASAAVAEQHPKAGAAGAPKPSAAAPSVAVREPEIAHPAVVPHGNGGAIAATPASVSLDSASLSGNGERSTPPETPPTHVLTPGNGAPAIRSNGQVDYASLDYSRWSPSQQIVKAIATAGFRFLARVETRGFENLPRSGPCLLAVNHLSMADVPLVLTLLPRRAIILANDTLRDRRILNWFVSDMGQAIYVRRNDLDEESLKEALTVLRAGGLVALAPEGTRSRTGGLLKGRTGVAYLATQADVPVVPLVAWGQERWRERSRSVHRLRIEVRAGKPMRFPQGTAPPSLLRQYTDRIMTALAELLPPAYRGVYAAEVNAPGEETPFEEVRPAS